MTTKLYFMDSGLHHSYPATGILGQPTGNMNQKLKLGKKYPKCQREFRDGDVAIRRKSGLQHQNCTAQSGPSVASREA